MYLMDGVYSCGYNVLLVRIHQTPAATNTQSSREETTGMRPEWRKANPKPLMFSALHELLQAYNAMLLPQRDWGSCCHPLVNSQLLPRQQLQGWAPLSQMETEVVLQTFHRLSSACCGKAVESWSSVPRTVKLKSHRASAFWKQLQFPFSRKQGSQIYYYLSSSKPHDIYLLLHSVYIIYRNLVLNSVTKWKTRW